MVPPGTVVGVAVGGDEAGLVGTKVLVGVTVGVAGTGVGVAVTVSVGVAGTLWVPPRASRKLAPKAKRTRLAEIPR